MNTPFKALHSFITLWLCFTAIGLGVLFFVGNATLFTPIFIGMELATTLIFLGMILWKTRGL